MCRHVYFYRIVRCTQGMVFECICNCTIVVRSDYQYTLSNCTPLVGGDKHLVCDHALPLLMMLLLVERQTVDTAGVNVACVYQEGHELPMLVDWQGLGEEVC